MDKNDIERILRLQNSAYELLLWLDTRAKSDQKLLSDDNVDTWRSGETCERWIREMHGMIPQAIRPAPEEIPAFARLFSSFFGTSFRLEVVSSVTYDYQGHPIPMGTRRLATNTSTGQKSSKAKSKVKDSARQLRLIALEALALENDMLLERADLEILEERAELRDALTLWTYFHELHRRAHFASQGEAVRSLWQAMNKKEREKMSANAIINARDELVAALKGR